MKVVFKNSSIVFQSKEQIPSRFFVEDDVNNAISELYIKPNSAAALNGLSGDSIIGITFWYSYPYQGGYVTGIDVKYTSNSGTAVTTSCFKKYSSEDEAEPEDNVVINPSGNSVSGGGICYVLNAGYFKSIATKGAYGKSKTATPYEGCKRSESLDDNALIKAYLSA